MSAGDVWGTIPCPYCTDHQVTVRETRRATGHFRCGSCQATGFFNEPRATFAARYQLEAPAESPPAPKAKAKRATKKSTKATTTRKGKSHGDDESTKQGGAREGDEGTEPQPEKPRGIGATFGF